MDNKVLHVNSERLAEYCSSLFQSVGMSKNEADINTDSLIEANLSGIDSHGISRMPILLKRIRSGVVNPDTKIEVISQSLSSAVIDAGNGMGASASIKAMQIAIDKAKVTGVSFVTVRNSNHFGTAAYFSKMAMNENMIGFSATNVTARMPPWGSKDIYFGTNPFSVAIPAGEELPVVADMATSLVARGKIVLAAINKQPIPKGWAINKYGEDTTDPQEALEGAVLPFAGPKGSAIALLIDVLAGILSGGTFGPHINDMYSNFTEPTGTGHFLGAIDISKYIPIEQFKKLMDQMIREIKSGRPVNGVNEIFLPGEIELRKRQDRILNGIPVTYSVLKELAEEGLKSGVKFPWENEMEEII